MLLHGQGVGSFQCFDGLPDLLDQCMRMLVILIDCSQFYGKNGKTDPLKTDEGDPWKTVQTVPRKTEEIDHLKTLQIAPPLVGA